MAYCYSMDLDFSRGHKKRQNDLRGQWFITAFLRYRGTRTAHNQMYQKGYPQPIGKENN